MILSAFRHAIVSYVLLLPASLIGVFLVLLGGVIIGLPLFGIYVLLNDIIPQFMPFAEALLNDSVGLVMIIFVLGAQWLAIRISLRYPIRILPSNGEIFSVISAILHGLLLLILWRIYLYRLPFQSGIVWEWLLFPFNGDINVFQIYPWWIYPISFFLFTMYEMKRQRKILK